MTMTPARRRATRATIAEGDNRNRNDGEDACASMATTSAHWRRQQHSQLRGNDTSRGGGRRRRSLLLLLRCRLLPPPP
jgi:hypothetical protein